MIPLRTYLLSSFCILLLLPATTSAQFFYFGQNKVHYTKFEWHVLKTEHFDIYYYPEMKDLAQRGAFFAEESYDQLVDRFNHNVLNRIPLIFYSSHLHFQQTNVTPGFIPEGVGGFFEFLKGRVVIPYNGSMKDFRHVIRHELVHVFMHNKVTRVLSDHRMTADRLPPLWFVEGLAEFWSTDWDTQAEMVIRDAVVTGYLVPLSDIDRIFGSYLMYKEGQNILQFVSRRYGDEKLLLLMENFWMSGSFEEVFEMTIGKNYEQFDEDWTYALKKLYYPLLTELDQPSAISDPVVKEGFNSKPVAFNRDGKEEVYFIGNHHGYTSVYRVGFDSTGKASRPELLVEGEKTNEFEAFHLFQSRMDVSKSGILSFVTKSGETDAIHLYDVRKKEHLGLLQFDDLVAIGSTSFSPDGGKIAFSSVDMSGNNDLYVWDSGRGVLDRLTNDEYDDRDPAWSPDGRSIVFTSDRTSFGESGAHNLFVIGIEDLKISYLTHGPESYSSPRFSPDGKALVFTSDRGGSRNIWMMKLDSSLHASGDMRKLTAYTTAAFDPTFSDSAVVFVAFEGFSFQIRKTENVYALFDSSSDRIAVPEFPAGGPWESSSLAGPSEPKSFKYRGEYSLDIAQSQIATDPVFGTAGGAFLAFSDLLGNEQYYFLVYNTAQSQDELFSSFNIAISRISLAQRANYAYGVFRFSGRRYDLTDPDEYFFERVFGGYFALSYPLSRFRRIETTTSISNSTKEVFESIGEREALFLSNSVSFTHDNSLWGPSGPLDGSRFKVTFAYTSDVQYSNANYYSAIVDYRRYVRLALRSAYATRVWLFYNGGKEARRFFMGGSWDLRGYPRWSIRGTKLWLTSHELRFPFVDQVGVRFPFGGIAFTHLRGAIFADAGNAWDDDYSETLGSVGVGARMNVAGFLVLRYDIGKRIENNFNRLQNGLFHQFFFGWDF